MAPCRTENVSAGSQDDRTSSCPICSTASPILHEIRGHHYHLCPNCSHQFLDYSPAATHLTDLYGDDYFSGGGDGYPDYLAERDLLIARGRKYADKVAKLTRQAPGSLLDIGSAAGFIARGFQQRGWTVQGLEPSPAMATHANEHLGVPTTNGSLETFATDERFDLILLVQVIAHLTDPDATFARLRSLLKPGGHLLIETWDSHSLTARALKKNWHEYNPPSVLHAFTRHSLEQLGERHGLKTLATRRTAKSIKAAHGKALLAHKLGDSAIYRWLMKPGLRLLPDRLSVPYPADDLFWTLLVVGQD